MKKKSILLLLVCSLFIVGCGSQKKIDFSVDTYDNIESTESSESAELSESKPEEEVVPELPMYVAELGKTSSEVTLFEPVDSFGALFVDKNEYWLAPFDCVKVDAVASRYDSQGLYINPKNNWEKGNDTLLSGINVDSYDFPYLFGISKDMSPDDVKQWLDEKYGYPIADMELGYKKIAYIYNISDDCVFMYSVDGKYFYSDKTYLILKDYLGYFVSEETLAEAGISTIIEPMNYVKDEEGALGKMFIPIKDDGTLTLRLANKLFTFSNLDGADEVDSFTSSYYIDSEGVMNVTDIGLSPADSRSSFPSFVLIGKPRSFCNYVPCPYSESLYNENAWQVAEVGSNYQIYKANYDDYWMSGANIFDYVIHFDDIDCNVNVIQSDIKDDTKSIIYAREIINYFNNYVTVETIKK